MRAMVLRQHGEIDAIKYEEDYPTPEAGEGEAIVRVKSCTLNAHDLFTLKGMPGIKIPFPVVMGIDIAGVVESVGSPDAKFKPGDRVMIDPINRETGKLTGEMTDGGLAEFVKVALNQLVALPDELDFVDASALPCAYGTAYRMMVTRGQIQADETVLILGASGGVGTCCVQLAKQAGAKVIAAASSEEKLQKLKELGADECVNYKEVDFKTAVHDLVGKPRFWGVGGVDVVVNYTGGETWVPSLKCLKLGGRLLTCGATAGFNPTEDIRYIWTFEHNIMGSNGWMHDDLHELIDLVRSGKLKPIVEKQYALEDAREAFADLRDRKAFGKIAIIP